jgi:hypothetical protein
MNCELVWSQFIAKSLTNLGPHEDPLVVFRDCFFSSALRCWAWTCEQFEGKNIISFVFCDGPTRAQSKIVDRHKKVVERHKKSRGHGGQISKTRISCVLSIDAKNSWTNVQDCLLGQCGIVLQTSEICILKFTFMFPFCIGNIEVRGDPGQTVEKKNYRI